jgi:hypothetical protein
MNTYNTYGALALTKTFGNGRYNDDHLYPKIIRDIVRPIRKITIIMFRVHNITFNILGYIPIVSFFSGITRISTGLLIVCLSIGFSESFPNTEVLHTGYCQMSRGALEAFIPYGKQ